MNTLQLPAATHLNFSTTPKLWQQTQVLLNTAASPITFDLNTVIQSDSSGVAFLIACQRYASELQKEIIFSNVPVTMQAMIRVSGLENILLKKTG